MPQFTEQYIQQVAQATDIVDLVGRYVALKKSGKEFVGLCPFHNDKRPSMFVSPVKQIFKCFACGAGGGVFQFVMKYDRLEFPAAVTALAERAGIPLPQDRGGSHPTGGPTKEDLLRVMTWAAGHYQMQLRASAGEAALKYALGRGFTEESIGRFGLGYAADGWDGLIGAARRKGIAEASLVAAGLAARRDNGPGSYDRFRNRLMFPIIDPAGRIIAFGGRALDPDDRAKYLNSPETMLFDKSANLYALNWSRDAIVSRGTAVVVEGYLDALIPLQAGVQGVVATLGTALGERHATILARYAREVVLVFDSDAAGAAATERALEIFLTQQLHVRVARVPDGKDPCDYTLAHGGEAMSRLVAEAPDALAYIWDVRQKQYVAAGGNLADRRKLVEDFLRLVVHSAAYGAIDEIRRGQLAQHIGHMLNIPSSDLQVQMRRMGRTVRRSAAGGAAMAGAAQPGPNAGTQAAGQPAGGAYVPSTALDQSERQVLEVLLNAPEFFAQAAGRISPADFADVNLAPVAGVVWMLGHEGRLLLENVVNCAELAQMGTLVSDLVTHGQQRGNYEPSLAEAVEHMVYRRNRHDTEQLRQSPLSDDVLSELGQRLKNADPRRHPKIT